MQKLGWTRTEELLQEAEELGIVMGVDGDDIRCLSPSGSLTPELKESLQEHKVEILALLESKQANTGMGLCPPKESMRWLQ
jgi:hypothetical protein